jgi:hypothetical protein
MTRRIEEHNRAAPQESEEDVTVQQDAALRPVSKDARHR